MAIDHDTFLWVTRDTLMDQILDPRDDAAWEEFVDYYSQYIYNIIRSMGVSEQDTIEIRQQVIVKLWRKLPSLKIGGTSGKFRNWLFSVVKNQVRDFIKQNVSRVNRESIGCRDCSYLASVEMPETHEMAEREWQEYVTQLCWEKTSLEFQPQVLKVFESLMEGKPAEEVAKECRITTSSVYVYKTRVRDSLRRHYVELASKL